ncbi:MAG: cell division protein CrgA [Microthrixaceae bacterium]
MAEPGADGSDGDTGTNRAADTGGSGQTVRKEKPLPPAAKKKRAAGSSRRSSRQPGSAADEGAGGRYTAPIPAAQKGPSPRWVPVLMFALWGIGLAMILLNYMGLLPGSDDGGNGWYLIGGLGLILGGIITATQYR